MSTVIFLPHPPGQSTLISQFKRFMVVVPLDGTRLLHLAPRGIGSPSA
jgi:hypothetical protein